MSKKSKDIEKSLDKVLDALNKNYGKGTVVSMNQAPLNFDRISTGSIKLDLALGGGYPQGKITEIFGDEGVGKSTLALHFLAQFKGSKVAYIDTEQALDREYAEHLGVDVDNMIISQPDFTEQALQITRELCTHVDGLVYDSIAEGSTLREMESEIGDRKIGDKAYAFNQAMRVMKAIKGKGTMIFINQIRQNPNITYGSNRVTPAGNAMKFATHVRLDIRRGGWIKKGSGEDAEKIGHYIRCKIIKNKTGRPHIQVDIPLIYDGNGINRAQEIIDLGLETGVITKKGSWYSVKDGNLAQGEANTRSLLEDNPEYIEELYSEIKNHYITE